VPGEQSTRDQAYSLRRRRPSLVPTRAGGDTYQFANQNGVPGPARDRAGAAGRTSKPSPSGTRDAGARLVMSPLTSRADRTYSFPGPRSSNLVEIAWQTIRETVLRRRHIGGSANTTLKPAVSTSRRMSWGASTQGGNTPARHFARLGEIEVSRGRGRAGNLLIGSPKAVFPPKLGGAAVFSPFLVISL
jgi:hypothetical protein